MQNKVKLLIITCLLILTGVSQAYSFDELKEGLAYYRRHFYGLDMTEDQREKMTIATKRVTGVIAKIDAIVEKNTGKKVRRDQLKILLLEMGKKAGRIHREIWVQADHMIADLYLDHLVIKMNVSRQHADRILTLFPARKR